MPKDFQETRKGSPIMKEKQPQQHVDLKVGHLIYIRYRDHVLYHRTQPETLGPQTRECVGWLIYDCADYIILTWDRDGGSPTLKGADPKASGLVLLRSDILELKRIG
jgi:hypothetical protein